MTNLLWVVVPILVGVVVASLLAYRTRRPRSLEHGIEEFHRELKALAPQDRRREEGGRRPG